jgi:hypothetical protein
MDELKLQTTTEPVFGKRARRLEIALALTEERLTIAQCARRLGLRPSVIYRPVRSMWEEGLLHCDEDSMERGARYWLPPHLREQAEAESRLGQPSGVVLPGQTLMVLEAPRISDLAAAVADGAHSSAVIWAAELDGGDRFLVVLDQSAEAAAARARFRAIVEKAGSDYQVSRVASVIGAANWRLLLEAVGDASS